MVGYTLVDYAILAILFASVLAGFLRGFLKEILSLATWVVACILASTFATTLASQFSGSAQAAFQGTQMSGTATQALSLLSIGISFVCIFVVVLIIGSIITYIIGSAFQATGINVLNRLLGGLFGAVRGYVIVVVVVFIASLTPITNQAAWTSSQLVGTFAPAAQWLGEMVSPSLQALKAQTSQVMQGISGQMQNIGNTFNNLGK